MGKGGGAGPHLAANDDSAWREMGEGIEVGAALEATPVRARSRAEEGDSLCPAGKNGRMRCVGILAETPTSCTHVPPRP
nr:unnamed protein product [Digitaria exilis]